MITYVLVVESPQIPAVYVRSSMAELDNLVSDLLTQNWVEDDFYFRTFEVEVGCNDPSYGFSSIPDDGYGEYVKFLRNS